MRVVVERTARDAAQAAARIIGDVLSAQPRAALALPTGHTAAAVYTALVAQHRAGHTRWATAQIFDLDEFLGLPRDDPRSFAAFLRERLLAHVDADPKHVHLLDGAARRWRDESARHERAVASAGGLDLAVLGLGTNGHIGFNEPAATLPAATHRVQLAAPTRRRQATAFGGASRVPRHAITMGVGTILRARRVLLVATGAAKARIVARALEGPLTTRVPASLLQAHPEAIAVLDRDAASRLRFVE
jgi:glucosamine-6-phosphate deaminase